MMAEDFYQALLLRLHLVIFLRKGEGEYELKGSLPDWFKELPFPYEREGLWSIKKFSPFLENFLIDAEDFWKKEASGVLRSGLWMEEQTQGGEIPLEAIALQFEGNSVLLLELARERFIRRRSWLQKTHQFELDNERCLGELEAKEVLAHCLVHDLSGPLGSIQNVMQMLTQEALSASSEELLTLSLQQASRLQDFIRDILDIYTFQKGREKRGANTRLQSVDIRDCWERAQRSLQPSLQVCDLKVELHYEGEQAWYVMAEPARLERVYLNLLDNAINHSRPGTTIDVTFRSQYKEIFFSIETEGVTIPKERASMLFQKFTQDQAGAGKAGLGLYFCRIMVEGWKGSIGYDSPGPRKNQFWFRLPLLEEE